MQALTLALFLIILTSLLALAYVSSILSKPKWDPRSRHCYVTGGSSGLGLALAILLTKKGADVSIVARNEERLQRALQELEVGPFNKNARQTPNQLLHAYSFGLDDAAGAMAALEAACKPHGGRGPDAAFLCAGKSTPGFFVEQDETSLRDGMNNGYWVQAWSALAATKHMAVRRCKGKIILVSSMLGYMSMIGYSSYSPAKWAVRGLAETLRSELLLYSIDVHIFFPPTIHSPGYVEENKSKPAITLSIEETDGGLSPETAAGCLLQGVRNGHFHITGDLLTDIFRSSTRGATPYNNAFFDTILNIIGWLGIPLWRRSVDGRILGHRQDHEDYLVSKGWYATDTQASP